MRILFLTNFYLVHGSGGEAQSCLQVVEGLKQRGHTTLVLTSMHETNNVPVEAEGTFRSLYLEMDLVPWRHSLTFFTKRKAREKHNLQCFERVLEQFEPDIIFIWGMWNLPKSLPAFAEARYPDKVVYRFATYWPTLPSQSEFYWRAPGRKWYSRLPKRVLSNIALAIMAKDVQQLPLTYKHAICVSAASRNILVAAGIPVSDARIIHTGLDIEPYLNSSEQRQLGHGDQCLEMLYAGRLVPDKGIDTAIKAMAKLVFGKGLRDIRLSLAGSGSTEYEYHLRQLVNQEGLTNYVTFLGWVPPEDMPELLRKFDVLLVPSNWAEPFARVVLEGMISGLAVVATPTGGTPEIVLDGENGLLFVPADADDLANKIAGLDADLELRKRLALAGQQTVVEKFTINQMMDEIENYLREVARDSSQKKIRQFERKERDTISVSLPTVSVIIPTHNRYEMLRQTLNSLILQTYPSDRYEVIVVDDGSTDGTEKIAAEAFPFNLRYFRQTNQGDAAARNLGAQQSRADILVFLDDDMLVEPGYLTHLIQAQDTCQNRIVVGTWHIWLDDTNPYTQIPHTSQISEYTPSIVELHFRDVYSNNMALTPEAYFKIGMMQGLGFSGSSMWCDLDFAYRAYLQGFEFFRSTKASCWHRDNVARSLDDQKKRMRTAAYRAVVLFQKHPELLPHLPMFHDKTPIIWDQDSPHLIARKLVRYMVSSRPALWSMEKLINVLENHSPVSNTPRYFKNYVIGGYIFQGYRAGLREFDLGEQSDEVIYWRI